MALKRSLWLEKWPCELDLARGTKARMRNHIPAVFSHLVRHELYEKLNPIASVRPGARPVKDPKEPKIDPTTLQIKSQDPFSSE